METVDLFEALALLKQPLEFKNFFKDLCTPQEMSALRERWRICQLLEKKERSYRDINALTGVSLTTIGRVARFLNEEPHQGYKNLLEKIKNRQN